MHIFIFSKPIRSGKTTGLLHWSQRQKNITGILMPDINGKRHIQFIETNEKFIVECDDPDNTNERLVNIGRFHFYAAAFEKANSHIIQASAKPFDWLVIDEVGRLEIEEKGFYPALAILLHTGGYKNLLLVVRDSLYEQVISFFKITDHVLIHQLNELGEKN